MKIKINENAPVVSKKSIEIKAPVKVVWDTLTNIQAWPIWQKSVSKTHVFGEIKEGTEFHWKADRLNFKSVIHTSSINKKFGWTGKITGVFAIHNWTFISNDNYTIVHVEESLEGILPKLFKKQFQKSLNQGMDNSLIELKSACEERNM